MNSSEWQAEISARLSKVEERIQTACQKYGRRREEVTLIAVSKTKPIEAVLAAHACGQIDFGENYLQDALTKIACLPDSVLTWHFIGHIQSNKCRDIARDFAWVHTVDRLKIAQRLAKYAPQPVNVLLQVNQSGEPTKSGVTEVQLCGLAESVVNTDNIKLRGLMSIPAASDDFEQQRQVFRQLRTMLEDLNHKGHNLDVLSMGMTGDFEAAIEEGATIVRVGTAIFGERH